MEYKEALNYIRTGEALLFVGAGFSQGAYNYSNDSVPNVKQLSERMIKSLNKELQNEYIPDPNDQIDLPYLSEYYLDKLGPKFFSKFLEKEFKVKKYSNTQKIISKEKWLTIFSTNYDDIIERITGKTSVSAETDDISSFNEYESVIHINGSINTINYSNVNTDLLLTNSSYIESKVNSSSIAVILRNMLNRAKAIFFVGFSFKSDLDLSRIYLNSNIKDKTFFITGEADAIEKNRLSKYGTITNLISEDFANDISKLPKMKINRKNIDDIVAFERIKPGSNISDNTDNLLNDLIIKGNFQEDYVLDSNYIADRWENAATIIEKNFPKQKIFIVQSKLGNGKSIFMRGLAQQLASTHDVFYFNSLNTELFNRDITTIKNTIVNPIIFIDDIYKLQSEFQSFTTLSDDITFVFSGRTSIINQTLPNLKREGKFSDEKIIFLPNLDIIAKKDFSSWESNVSKYNLWGTSNRKKIKNYNQFSTILSEFFESQGIVKKYEDLILSDVVENKQFQPMIISILVLNILSSSLSLNDILMPFNFLESDKMHSSPLLNEYINFEQGLITNKGPVLSKKLLQNNKVFSPQKIIDTLVRMMKAYDNSNKKGNRFNTTKRDLVSFSNLKLLLGFKQYNLNIFNAMINDYYKQVMNYQFAKNNPFFWIQFAKSKISAGDWEMALTYVGNAKASTKNQPIADDYQIISTEINIYMESALDTIITNKQLFIDRLEKSIEIMPKIHDIPVILSLFAKLGTPPLISEYTKMSTQNRQKIYSLMLDLYSFLQLSTTKDEKFKKKDLKRILKVMETTKEQTSNQ